MFNLRGPQGQNPRTTCGPRTTVWKTLSYGKQWAVTSAIQSLIHCLAICTLDYAAANTTGAHASVREYGISYTKNNTTVNQNNKEFFPLDILNSPYIQYDPDMRKHILYM
jgi:hypothetical protein